MYSTTVRNSYERLLKKNGWDHAPTIRFYPGLPESGYLATQLNLICIFNVWGCRRVTFICGQAGVYAIGAVAAKHAGDERLLGRYLTQFKGVL